MRRYLVEKSLKLKNIDIFAFDNEDFTNNLYNYQDPKHYRGHINHLILKKINSNSNILNITNIKNYEKKLVNKISICNIYSSKIKKDEL